MVVGSPVYIFIDGISLAELLRCPSLDRHGSQSFPPPHPPHPFVTLQYIHAGSPHLTCEIKGLRYSGDFNSVYSKKIINDLDFTIRRGS